MKLYNQASFVTCYSWSKIVGKYIMFNTFAKVRSNSPTSSEASPTFGHASANLNHYRYSFQ